jgi:hypothetical protein
MYLRQAGLTAEEDSEQDFFIKPERIGGEK